MSALWQLKNKRKILVSKLTILIVNVIIGVELLDESNASTQNRGMNMKKRIVTFLLASILLFSLSVAEASGLDDFLGGISSLFSKSEEDAHAPGETVEVDDVEITLTDVLQSSGNSYYKPQSGKVFLMIEFKIKNNRDDELDVSSLLSFSTWCDDELCVIDLEALGTGLFAGKPQLDCVIEAGKTITGIVGYQVDKDWEKVIVEYSTDVYFGEKVKFLVEK